MKKTILIHMNAKYNFDGYELRSEAAREKWQGMEKPKVFAKKNGSLGPDVPTYHQWHQWNDPTSSVAKAAAERGEKREKRLEKEMAK